jgi:hypothetical protein
MSFSGLLDNCLFQPISKSEDPSIDKAVRDLGETLSTLTDSDQQLLVHLKERMQSASRQLRLADHLAKWHLPPVNFDLTLN